MSEQLNELPAGWCQATVRSLLAEPPCNGLSIRGSESPPGTPALKLSAIKETGFDYSKKRYLPIGVDEIRGLHIAEGDFFVARGSGSLSLVGKGTQAQAPTEPIIFPDTMIRLRIVPPISRTRWIATVWRSAEIRSQIEGLAKTTAGIWKISQSDVCGISIPIPPENEQRRIVAKLDVLTARSRRAKEALDAIPPLIERFRKAVLAAAFRGDLTAAWREKNPDVEPAKELLKRIRVERRRRWEEAELARLRAKGKPPGDDRWKAKYEEPEPVDTSDLPDLPEGWAWASLGQLADVAGGLTKNNAKRVDGSEVPLVSVAAVRLKEIDRSAIGRITLLREDGDKGELRRDDLLVVEGNGSLAHIGRVALWDIDVPGARHQNHLIRVRPVVLQSSYLLEWLASPLGRECIMSEATSASGLYTLSISKIERLAVPVSPLSEQAMILQEIQRVHEPLTRVALEVGGLSSLLSDLERSLLAKAFRGELVPQDPSDEPASVLLERIRAEREAASSGKPARRSARRRAPSPVD